MRSVLNWGKTTAVLLTVLGGGVGVACVGPATAAYSPAERSSEASMDRLYRAGEGALLEHGYLIAVRDPENGRLETEPRTLAGSGMSGNKFRYAWTLEVGDGRVALSLRCAQEPDAELSPCAEAPERIVNEQPRILDHVLEEATGPDPNAAPEPSLETDAGGVDNP